MYVLVWVIIINFLFLDFTKLLDFLPGDALLQIGAMKVDAKWCIFIFEKNLAKYLNWFLFNFEPNKVVW